MDVITEERRLTSVLGAWAVGSVLAGSALWLAGRRAGRPELTGFGRQTAMWGAVDGAIALAGVAGRRRRAAFPDAEELEAHRVRLRTTLALNSAADVAYIAGGAALVRRAREGRRTWGMNAGDGAAIVVQGAFLLALDSVVAWRLRG